MRKKVLSLDYTFALKETNRIGGIARSELRKRIAEGNRKSKELFIERVSGNLGFYSLPYFEKEAKKIARFSKRLLRDYNRMVVLGIGGSALGSSAVISSLRDRLPDQGGRVLVIDNIDPDGFSQQLLSLDLDKTVFNVISKSGSTAETLSQFFSVASRLKKKIGKGWKNQIIITTDPETGYLRDMAEKEGFVSFPVPQTVGGRFSVFSPVGLLPISFAGVKINDLLEGARYVDGVNLGTKGVSNPILLLSSIYSHFMEEQKKNSFIFFSYSQYLDMMGEWFCQLWGESLGKKRKGKESDAHIGQTPVSVRGVTDQHSQLQLYADGPDDKVFTFVGPGMFKKDFSIRPLLNDERVNYLGGKKLGDLFKAEMDATIYSLAARGRPLVVISPGQRDEFTMGALIFLFECVTALTGKMLGIDPFNQPGVEYGKELTRAMMGDKASLGFMDDVKRFEKSMGENRIELELS